MQIGFRTNTGQKRKNNQDAVGVFYNNQAVPLVIVADGMGGHQAGDVASQMVVSDLGETWKLNELAKQEDILQWLLRQIQLENEAIYEKGQQEDEFFGMGTTIVAGAFVDDELLLAHVGDSRCYLLRQDKLKQLTEDHSLVNELLKSGEITAEMATHHPRKNVLVRSVGMPGAVDVDMLELALVPGDRLVLCSDGLTNMLTDKRISEIILSAQSLDERLEQLIEEANQAGGKDNITVLVVEYEGNSEGLTND